MAAAGGPDTLHGEPEDGDERLRVPGTARGEACEVAIQRVVDVGGRERKVHRERRPRVDRTAGGDEGEEPLRELRPALRGQLEAGRGRMTTETDEQVPACTRASPRG